VSRTIALIGDPVAHSVSPAMQNAAFAALGLDAEYVALRIPLPDLPRAFGALREGFAGLNVTRPLKEAVAPLLDRLSPEAARTGSVNTVAFREGHVEGHSTDGAGFLAALRAAGAADPAYGVILGAGGAARAVTWALADLGTELAVTGRNAEAGERLAAEVEGAVSFVAPERGALARAVAAADLLVNATPVGEWPDVEACPLPDGIPLHPSLTVFDLVYRPRVTSLLARARTSGCRSVEGVEMLVSQGAASFEVWTGLPAPVGVMRRAALETLERHPAEDAPEAAETWPGVVTGASKRRATEEAAG
jgi:shikimate dehydrogenase